MKASLLQSKYKNLEQESESLAPMRQLGKPIKLNQMTNKRKRISHRKIKALILQERRIK